MGGEGFAKRRGGAEPPWTRLPRLGTGAFKNLRQGPDLINRSLPAPPPRLGLCSEQHPAPQHPAGYIQHPAPRPQTSPARCAPLSLLRRTPATPCRWPPPTVRTRVAPRAQGSPSTATTRPAAASSPPITSGEGARREGGQRLGPPGSAPAPGLAGAPAPWTATRTRPHPGHATAPAAPVCCAPVPTPAPHPGADLGPATGFEAVGGWASPLCSWTDLPPQGFLCERGLQVPYLFPHTAG